MKYLEALIKAMEDLSKDPRILFIGQSVKFPGTSMFNSLVDVPEEKKIELPVFEDTQMGITLGLSITGKIPISVFPRQNFLLASTHALVQHVDKWRQLTGQTPHLIVRTAVADGDPPNLDPGPQHLGDYTDALAQLAPNVIFRRLRTAEQVMETYVHALANPAPYVLVEYARLYDNE